MSRSGEMILREKALSMLSVWLCWRIYEVKSGILKYLIPRLKILFLRVRSLLIKYGWI